MTKEHAHRIAKVFEEMYPQHVGVVQVITSTIERVRDGSYGDGLITKFKKNNLPRIAISVDLDTGIDVPEVVNLVFMKPVQSRIKPWQMIGRGSGELLVTLPFPKLFVSQSLNGIQARGTDGGHHTAYQPYCSKDKRGHDQSARSNDQADVAGFRVLRHSAV